LFQRVLDSLQSECVDIAPVQEKGKIRGIVFGDSHFARFQIRLFQAEKQTVVEFQRREGEAMLLISLYRRDVASLGPDVVCRQWAESAPPQAPLPELPEPAQPQPQLVLSSLDSLLTLASSTFEDQRKEAVTGLVALTTQHAPILLDAASYTSLIVVLLKLLTSNNLLEIVRGSALCLSALLQASSAELTKRPIPTEVGQSLTSGVVELLEAPALLECLDTKRHAAKSIQSIAKANPALLSKHRRTLNKYANSKDTTLRANVQKTLQLISVAS